VERKRRRNTIKIISNGIKIRENFSVNWWKEGRENLCLIIYVIATYCMHVIAIHSSSCFIFISSIISSEYNSFEKKTKWEFNHHLCWWELW
jgi:hypothetical protein